MFAFFKLAVLVVASPAASLCCAAEDVRDEVVLASGETLHGRVTLELEDRLCMQVGRDERWLERGEIQSLSTVSGALRELWSGYASEHAESAEELKKHAAFCKDQGLLHEEQLFLWRLLCVEPDCAEAHERLGHRLRGSTWIVKVGSRWVDLARAREMRESWTRAWELRSEHFELKCDAGLDNALDVLFMLELLYHQFFGLYQRELELRELLEPIPVEVFRNPSRFPAIGTATGSIFSNKDGILYAYAAGKRLIVEPLLHEGVQALIHALAGRSRGAFPAWMFEAWPLYLLTRLEIGEGGMVSLKAETSVNQGYCNVLAAERKPVPLTRLLNFDEGDYRAGTSQALHFAQSYLLFHFLEHSEEGKHRPALREYQREALAGKGQLASFRRVIPVDLRELDRAYRAYALRKW